MCYERKYAAEADPLQPESPSVLRATEGTASMTTTIYCPPWCGIDHDRIESEGSHTAEVATWVGNGSVDYVRQPCGDYEVQLWHAGDVALALPTQGSGRGRRAPAPDTDNTPLPRLRCAESRSEGGQKSGLDTGIVFSRR